MLREPTKLSLSDWPNNPPTHSSLRLSPLTARTLKDSRVSLESILPISFGEFRLLHHLTEVNAESKEMYDDDCLRRKTKVEILRGLRIRIKQGKEHRKTSSSVRSSVVIKRQSHSLDRNLSQRLGKFKNSCKKSSSPLLFKVGSSKMSPKMSPKNNPVYSDYYTLANNQEKNTKRLHTEDESTKSWRRQNDIKGGEYFERSSYKKRKQKSPTFKETIIAAMNEIVKKWSELDEKQTRERQQLRDVSEAERGRLIKIHKIEKDKLRADLENVKTSLTTKRKLSKHFL